MKSKVWLILPAYNEGELIEKSVNLLDDVLNRLIENGKLSADSRILFVDDGSDDDTWAKIAELHNSNEHVKGLRLAVNVGQQSAIFAGIMQAKVENVDAIITLDVDLQDDIEKIETFIDKMNEGYEAVFGVHNDRKTDNFMKKFTASVFYKLMRFMGVNVIENHSEFRLLNRTCLERLSEYKETNLFLRALTTGLTKKYTVVNYERKTRLGGTPKFSFNSSFELAIDGITAFTLDPIRMIWVLGLTVMVFSLLMLVKSLLIFTLWFLGGLQLVAIGVIGEYIAKINKETKKRPRYFVEEVL